MSEHTPTPWVLGVDGVGDIFDADNRSIAKTDAWNVSTHRTPRENRANAAFIVKAVNAHDDLVKALTLAEDILSRRPFSTEIWPNGMHPQDGIEQIRAALASIKERA